MKKYIIIQVVFLFLISCGSPEHVEESTSDTTSVSQNNQSNEAVDFNNEITFMQEGILNQVETLFRSDSGSIDLNLENTLFEIDLNLSGLSQMKIATGGDSLVSAMIGLHEFYKNEFTGEFQKVAELLKKAEWTKKEEDFISTYDENFAKQEAALVQKIIEHQNEFANLHRIELVEQY